MHDMYYEDMHESEVWWPCGCEVSFNFRSGAGTNFPVTRPCHTTAQQYRNIKYRMNRYQDMNPFSETTIAMMR